MNIHEDRNQSRLKIRVVLWPQSTKTSVGPPDSDRWWSGDFYWKSHHKRTVFFFKTSVLHANVSAAVVLYIVT